MIFPSYSNMKGILTIVSVLFMVIAFSACNKKRTATNCSEKVKDECICTQVYEPVCGCNNITYSNECEAQCHGISDFTAGACQ